MNLETIRQEIRDKSSSFSFLWNNIREGLAFVDHEGIMRIVSPSFANFLGYSVGELENQQFSKITINQDVEADLDQFGRLCRGEIDEYQMVKSYNTKARNTITCKRRAVSHEGGTLVLGQILPVDTLSLEQLPEEDMHRVVSMLVGRLVFKYKKRFFFGLLGLLGVSRLDQILEIFR